ncbi:WSC domain-containing protein [Xylariaceae sp. AK1471]|nr:WSC domain-containing protein [Xylariaceae sp. AK1471]
MIRQVSPSSLTLTLLSLVLTFISFLPSTTAQSSSSSSITTTTSSLSSPTPSPSPSKPALEIVTDPSNKYTYVGCYNETSALPNTNGLRALQGISEALPGVMTVEKCLDFCVHGDTSQKHPGAYALAGLQYSRECWCADTLNSLSVKLADADCDTPCDGANTTACGGALRLSLYNYTGPAADKKKNAAAGGWGKGGVVMSMGTTVVVVILGFASRIL